MAVTNFIWDELSDNVLLETDETDALTARYTNRPEQFGKLLSQYRIEDEKIVERFYHYDGEYSTRDLTDREENVTDTFIYTAYGEEVARTGTTTNPFGYKGAVGYYTNAETSDIYVRARTYEPAMGCWLSTDPLGFIDGTNLYRAYFVFGGIDPSGNCRKKIDCEWKENWTTTTVVNFSFELIIRDSCVASDDPWEILFGICGPCNDRCTGLVHPELTFHAERVFRWGPNTVHPPIDFRRGQQQSLFFCEDEKQLELYEAPNTSETGDTLSATIFGKKCENDCCDGGKKGTAYIASGKKRKPWLEVDWDFTVSECGDIVCNLNNVRRGSADGTLTGGGHRIKCTGDKNWR